MDDTKLLENNTLEHISLALYGILIVEIIFFAIILEFVYSGILLLFLIALLWYRRVFVDDEKSSITRFRALLKSILNNRQRDQNNQLNSAELPEDSFNSIQSSRDSEIIDNLREIGLDGVLILLFLVKNQTKLCSIKTIREDLQIPSSTLYRNIAKLEEIALIRSQQIMDHPGKFYTITEYGKSLVGDLYELVSLAT